MTEEDTRWSQPFAALLGAYDGNRLATDCPPSGARFHVR